MKRIVPGALAGLVATAALAAPAQAAPANVTVRVEGEAQTLLPRTAVTTDTNPVLVDGSNACPGTSAGGALHKALAGDIAGTWGDFGFQLLTVKGETHDEPVPADPALYWSFWVNYEFQNAGLCGTETQEGDDILLLVDCFSMTSACASRTPLRLSGVPATVALGQAVTVKVEQFKKEYDPVAQSTKTTPEPADGATITAGGQATTTAGDGAASLSFTTPGPVTIAATKAGRVRTAAVTCVTTGNDGNCGTQLPPGTPLGTELPDDKTAPIASFSGLAPGTVFARKRAPRELEGSVTPDPSGLKSVRLSIMRKRGKRCWAFDGGRERFERHRCGGSLSFRIGDRADWSYLLPRRLPRGRYTIKVVAIDKVGNSAATETVIRVR